MCCKSDTLGKGGGYEFASSDAVVQSCHLQLRRLSRFIVANPHASAAPQRVRPRRSTIRRKLRRRCRDVSMFSRLPEADQRAILRQADDKEFERYVTHAHMKIRAQAREERAGKRTEAPAPSSAPASRASASPPWPARPLMPPPRSAPPSPPRGRSMADQLPGASPLSAR
jgi:hypothetical protein